MTSGIVMLHFVMWFCCVILCDIIILVMLSHYVTLWKDKQSHFLVSFWCVILYDIIIHVLVMLFRYVTLWNDKQSHFVMSFCCVILWDIIIQVNVFSLSHTVEWQTACVCHTLWCHALRYHTLWCSLNMSYCGISSCCVPIPFSQCWHKKSKFKIWFEYLLGKNWEQLTSFILSQNRSHFNGLSS